MTQTSEHTNGYDTDRASTTHGVATQSEHGVATQSEIEEGYKALQVKPSTHALVRAAAMRLDRSADSIVLAGVLLVNAKTASERAQTDAEWAKSIGGQS